MRPWLKQLAVKHWLSLVLGVEPGFEEWQAMPGRPEHWSFSSSLYWLGRVMTGTNQANFPNVSELKAPAAVKFFMLGL